MKEAALLFRGHLLARFKLVSDDLVLLLHFFEFFFGLFVAGESSLNTAFLLQSAVLTMRHCHAPITMDGKLTRACLQLSKIKAEAKWTPARKFLASLS